MGETTKAYLISCRLDGAGGYLPVDAASTAEDSRTLWLHLNGRHAETKKILREQFSLDALVVKSMLAEETRPRIEETPAGTLLILRGINFNPGPEPEDLVSIRLWISGSRVVSIARRKSAAIGELETRLKEGRGPKDTGEFIAQLCSALSDTIEPAIADLEENIDKMEDDSLVKPNDAMRADLSLLRKQATLFRRHMTPQRDVVSHLIRTEKPWMSADHRWMIQDSLDRITRFVEDIDMIRERAQIVQDQLHSLLSDRLNRNIYLLSIVTALFMPLAFLTGLLGMNVAGIPYAEHPNAFAIVCGICFAIGAVQLLIFRKLKWL